MMNRGDLNPNNGSDLGDAVDLVCREFERKFADDPGFRIEHLSNEDWKGFARLGPHIDAHDARKLVVAELIYIEMELRWKAGQWIDADEYRGRLPGFAPTIEEAINRLLQRHSSFCETCSVVNVRPDERASASEFAVRVRQDSPSTPGIPESLGRFREIAQIKSGSFGIVCRAIDSRDGRAVALKFPRKDRLPHDAELKMFLTEASKAMKLDHPGIARTFAIEESDGYLAIVQEFIEGSDLSAAGKPMRDHRQIAELVAEIADALAYAHQQGVFHRDLKPANVLIDPQGRPHIVDFGLAMQESEQIYLPRQRCGTAHYMSPEQVAGLTRLMDGRSDIWSLGVILYELLTKQRAFKGVTEADVFDQVENRDPRPLRQIDSSIDPELQRICLKCLERKQRDRYLTADELADDLRHWVGLAGRRLVAPEGHVQFIPKGLRSYTAEDAPFFLDLLPGPRDRDGLPHSIRFWKTKICEPVAEENCVPVGVVFGPSGSGKSSFIKAGLLPQLPAQVKTIYVEATPADTEVRLLKGLRQSLEGVPDDISLPELFRGLSRGQWRPSAFTKLLIVIDQFEQRLSHGDDFGLSQLARAIRYCDGKQLQCLLLTRDDFMMALSRFADALEMDLREGENSQAIDLFDRKHARRVLAKLGRAFDQLPRESVALSEERESFLDEAVNQLSRDNHVICVHLVLFAEMFRHRPWTPTELNLVGGVAGTGEKFLEATFGDAARDKRYRSQREPAQRVLEALLPSQGTDIRGAMKPQRDLVAAAKLQDHHGQFDELIKSLDGQLKLITRTDPDRPLEGDSGASSRSSRDGYFQLTHDYLVPSVRSWLDHTLGTTRAGRARLRLRNLAGQLSPGQPPQNLPTNLEWIVWQFQIPASELGQNERTVMRAAGRRFLRQAAIAAAILLVAGGLAGYALYQSAYRDRVAHVEDLIDDLLNQRVETAPQIVARLTEQRSIAEPMLRAMADNRSLSPNEQTRVAMGLVSFDAARLPTLIETITRPECGPDELFSITQILSASGISAHEQLSQLFHNTSAAPRSRFRALCAYIQLQGATEELGRFAGLSANVLWDEPVTSINRWIEMLQPVGEQFAPEFVSFFSETDDPHRTFVLAQALFGILQPSDRIATLANLVGPANESQFDAILSTVEANGAGKDFANVLEKTSMGQLDDATRTNLSLAMARLGREAGLIKQYAEDIAQRSTIFAITFSTNRRIRLESLRQIYEQYEVATSDDVGLRRSMLQVFALQSTDVFDSALKEWLAAVARRHVEDDLDACCFSTSELILTRLGRGDGRPWRQVRRNKPESKDGVYGNILIDANSMAFSVIDYTNDSGMPTKFAIATTEVTNQDIAHFKTIAPNDHPLPNPSQPFRVADATAFRMLYDFCNHLSDESGLKEQACYPTEITIDVILSTPADSSHTGYRLPTVEEWVAANESNRVLEEIAKESIAPVIPYAWIFHNAGGQLHDVATRLPNAAGLFDSFGNAQEICQLRGAEVVEFYELGKESRSNASALTVDRKGWYPRQVLGQAATQSGFRLARTLQ